MHGMLEGSLNSGKAGCYREKRIFVSGSEHSFPSPEEVPSHMEAFEKWLQTERGKLHPVEFAVLLHKDLVTIHPFEDGNGRISRLAMNAALLQNGYLPILVPPILRNEYINSLQISHKDDTDFKNFMFRQQIEAQRSFLRLVNHKDKGYSR